MEQLLPVEKLVRRPHYISVTVNTDTGDRNVTMTFEFRGKLSEFGGFLLAIRSDLWKNGLHTTAIVTNTPGISFMAIVPDPDSEAIAFPVFHVQNRRRMRANHEKWVASVEAWLKRRVDR